MEKEVLIEDRELVLRRIKLKEKRVENDNKRAKNAAEGRQKNLKIQSKMMDFDRAQIQKNNEE